MTETFAPCGAAWDEPGLAEDRIALKAAISEAAGLLLALAESLRKTTEGELALYGDQAANVEGAAATLRVFALDVEQVLTVEGKFGGPQGRDAMQGHILAQASLTGMYSLNPSVTI